MCESFLKLFLGSALLALNAFAAAPACAQADPRQVAELALYQKEDRLQKLIEGAKREGELNYYQSRTDIGPVIDAFSKKYGIKVKMWRSSGENVLQRILTEARAGKTEVDIVETSAPQVEALHRENLLQRVISPLHADLMPQAIAAHKEWVGTTVDVYVQAYNTDKIKKEELPKSYQDLLNPKWKGMLGIESADEHWFAMLTQELGKEKGEKLFRDIVATNGISVRKGHSLLANMVGSGEVPLGLTIYNYSPEQLKQKGTPIESFIIPPAISQFVTMALMKRSPHPHAALLFYDFMLSEGQEMLSKRAYIPTTSKIDSPLKNQRLTFVDPAMYLDMSEKWIKTFEDIVSKKGK
jgi:iron(III) transport system substrate-binding protein